MDIFEQETFDFLMDRAAFGSLSPYEISTRQEWQLPTMHTFPDEVVNWVANVTVDRSMWGTASTGRSGSFDVFLGVSPYRLVFFREEVHIVGKNQEHCKSYWFALDFEGWKWRRKKRRKMLYFTDLRMDEPQLQKSPLSQTIRMKNLLTQDNGKTRDFISFVSSFCDISSIKWLDPATGKKAGRKAELVYQEIMKAYRSQVTVKASELAFLQRGPEYLEQYLSLGKEPEKVEGRIIRPAEPEVVSEPEEIIPDSVEPQPSVKSTLVCKNCGQALKPGWKICPRCGDSLPRLCSNCGQPLEEAWKLCPFCGSPS